MNITEEDKDHVFNKYDKVYQETLEVLKALDETEDE